MKDLVSFLNDNAGVFSLVFTSIVTASTVAYAILTASLVRETKVMRRAETDPALAVYLHPYPRAINFFELVIQNHGRGIARNISWRVNPTPEQIKERGVEIHSLALLDGLSQLAPGQSIRSFFGNAVALLKEPPLEPITVLAEYESVSGERLESSFVLDIRQFSGISQLGHPPEYDAVKALEKLADAARSVVQSGRIQVLITTHDEIKRRQEEFLAQLQREQRGED